MLQLCRWKFSHRHFVADFIRLKLNFIEENKVAFSATLWRTYRGNKRTPSIARWKARYRLAGCLTDQQV